MMLGVSIEKNLIYVHRIEIFKVFIIVPKKKIKRNVILVYEKKV